MDADMVKIFWILMVVLELAMILGLAGKDARLNFHLGVMLAQVIIWYIFTPGLEVVFFKENGWIVVLATGVLLWFLIPLLKKEISRGDSGGMVFVEEDDLV